MTGVVPADVSLPSIYTSDPEGVDVKDALALTVIVLHSRAVGFGSAHIV